jgi:hypothetical protein
MGEPRDDSDLEDDIDMGKDEGDATEQQDRLTGSRSHG